MILGEDTVENFTNTGLKYSAMPIEELGSSEYTLVNIYVDTSGSVDNFKIELEKCLIATVKSCSKSPRANNLLLRIVLFNSVLKEVHGYKELSLCNESDYSGIINPAGLTALLESIHECYSIHGSYAEQLRNNKYKCNGISFFVTDGLDNIGGHSLEYLARQAKELVTAEKLESHLSILIGVNVKNPGVSAGLQEIKDKAQMDQYVEIENADEKSLARLANFVTQSISSQSVSLGTGAASQTLNY